jgi:hypothetical protein
MKPPFDDADRRQLRDRGISEDEAARQLGQLGRPQRYADLDRPCARGDGIEVLAEGDVERLAASFVQAIAAPGPGRPLRPVKFVPASGAATRMFRDLLRFRGGEPSWDELRALAGQGRDDAKAVLRVREELDDLAWRDDVERELLRRGVSLDEALAGDGPRALLDALLDGDRLGYADLPKGLLPFHRYDDASRTPFEEHLTEAADHARDRDGRCRLHFTVSPQHLERFRELLARVAPERERTHGVSYEVDFSEQKPATDTLAVDLDGAPFRDDASRLLFRPGGHGALIRNLGEIDADVVFVKNIDNVQPDRAKPETLRWKRALGGRLLELRGRIHDLLRCLRDGDGAAADEALDFVGGELGYPVPATTEADARRRFALDRLDRPLRVCGVVPNTGEPGGGPFWVRESDGGLGRQIVETAQIDPGSEAQQAILRAASHFNPVDLVCAITDADGRRYDLERFIDPEAVIVARKSAGGRDLLALERPGLWNGAMAGWNTVFVEVPLSTFTPVKTVLDLLRPEHR